MTYRLIAVAALLSIGSSAQIPEQLIREAGQPPAITDVVDAGAFLPKIAQAGWFTVRGSGLAASTRLWSGADFDGNSMPTTLDGTGVTVNGKPAVLYYISPSQLNALAPLDTSTGPVTVTVTTPQGTASKMATLTPLAPSFFMLDPDDRRYVAAVNLNGTLVGRAGLYPASPNATTPLTALGRATLYGTGWGLTDPVQPNGQVFTDARPLVDAAKVNIAIGNVLAQIEFAGAVGPGLYQFNIVAPDVFSGDYPITGELAGVQTQPGAWITIANNNGPPAPAIFSVNPDIVQAGQVIDTLTISGNNLTGIKTVVVFPADGVSVSLVKVTATSLTAKIAIAQLATPGRRSITVGDGTITSNAIPFSIAAPRAPALSVTKTHSGTFRQGQTGATYTVTVGNGSSAGPTSGTVFVTETVPKDMTLVSMNGTGWACSGNTCTRTDSLSAGGSYPPITVTVNVSLTANSQQVNTITVSGGGSPSAAASDPTNISATARLSITKTHADEFRHGATGAYTVIVGNSSSAGPTSGIITVTEIVPPELILVSMSGFDSWSCSANICTTSNVLLPGYFYDPIKVIVVANEGHDKAVNTVSVMGGGSPAATASDPTTIQTTTISAIDLTPGVSTRETLSGYYTCTPRPPCSGTVYGALYRIHVPETVAQMVLHIRQVEGHLSLYRAFEDADVSGGLAVHDGDSLLRSGGTLMTGNYYFQASAFLYICCWGDNSASLNETAEFTVFLNTQAQPVLSVTKTHTGNFTLGQEGTYTVTVSNSSSAGPTRGTITVAEMVSSDSLLNSMSGTGWTCSYNTCTRSDVLSPGASYPPINVIVSVRNSAISPLVNTVSVTGGGSSAGTASDSTILIGP